MSAVEEIEAAINKLTGLRDSSLSAPWVGWRQYNPLRGELYGIESRGEDIAKTYGRSETELIETLHRTIDAQLELLNLAIEYGDLVGGQGSRFVLAATHLARAINETSA